MNAFVQGKNEVKTCEKVLNNLGQLKQRLQTKLQKSKLPELRWQHSPAGRSVTSLTLSNFTITQLSPALYELHNLEINYLRGRTNYVRCLPESSHA